MTYMTKIVYINNYIYIKVSFCYNVSYSYDNINLKRKMMTVFHTQLFIFELDKLTILTSTL